MTHGYDALTPPHSKWLVASPIHSAAMEIEAMQRTIAATYLERDRERGVDATFRWFTEEVGELARAIRTGERPELVHEFSDVLAWLASLANLLEVDLTAAVARYANGCPKCNAQPCVCPMQ